MSRRQIRCHGDDRRFSAVADLIDTEFGPGIRYIADVAGGQGMLCRLLRKKGFDCEVIDTREHVLKGIRQQQSEFGPEQASYYDLIVGLHPDQALRPVVLSSLHRPTIVVPCCNFWSTQRMGLKQMLSEIEEWYRAHGVSYREVRFDFAGPYNRGFITSPPRQPVAANLSALAPDKLTHRSDWTAPTRTSRKPAKSAAVGD
jgi:hypothetical protein